MISPELEAEIRAAKGKPYGGFGMLAKLHIIPVLDALRAAEQARDMAYAEVAGCISAMGVVEGRAETAEARVKVLEGLLRQYIDRSGGSIGVTTDWLREEAIAALAAMAELGITPTGESK